MRVASGLVVPHYPKKPIGSRNSLAKMLGVPLDQLVRIASASDSSYRKVPETKKDGSTRITYDAKAPLKTVQGSIVKSLLRRVDFPHYLQGGIRDKRSPRDYVSNAAVHSQAHTIILNDVSDFFPSIGADTVAGIWAHIFRLPPEVTDLLTQLTTYRGTVPQGARTSSYLANLAFWDKEAQVVAALEEMGLTYSRFVDDITVSARRPVTNEVKTEAIRLIYGMLASKGCRPKRTKSRIVKVGCRMEVTGLVVNHRAPSVAKDERRRVRAAVHELERHVADCEEADLSDFQSRYDSVLGRVQRIERLGHPEGPQLRQRLEKLRVHR